MHEVNLQSFLVQYASLCYEHWWSLFYRISLKPVLHIRRHLPHLLLLWREASSERASPFERIQVRASVLLLSW